MANTLTIKTGIKGMDNTFTAMVNGKDLKPNQKGLLTKFLKDIGHTEQPKQEQPKQEPEITLSEWTELTPEQQQTLKTALLKSTYGLGGEHFSSFPTLLTDSTTNTWVTEKYQTKKLPKRLTEQTFRNWKINGELKILPILKGEKVYYQTILLPNKDIKMDLWELEKELIKPFQNYTTKNMVGTITLGNTHFHLLNSYTNKNKAYNQSKLLVKLFQLGTPFTELEQQKELQQNYLQLDITNGEWELKEISKNTHKPTGKAFKDIGEYLGREQHKDITTNYTELLRAL